MLRVALVFLIIANIIDALLTAIWVRMGLAEEANPIMVFFLLHSTPLFITIKLFLAFGGIYILYRYAHRLSAKIGICVCAAVYLYILYCHLPGITFILQ